MKALGMIEVIGLPPAIEAADSALKAANVDLLAIAKADAGILTVEITGEVGAVTAAVDAGAAAAEQVGTLRAKHVIPNVDESLVGKILVKGTKLFQPKTKSTIPISQTGTKNKGTLIETEKSVTKNEESVIDNGKSGINSEESGTVIESPETKNKEPIVLKTKPRVQKIEPITTYTVTELKKKSNDTLRGILQSQGVELTDLQKNAKKQELIQLIITQQNQR